MKARRKLKWRLTSVMLSIVLLVTMIVPPAYVRAEGDEPFTAWAKQENFTVKPGDSVTLEVLTNAPEGMELSYEWQRRYYENGSTDFETMDGETGAALVIQEVSAETEYYCYVRNQDEYLRSVHFSVYIDNQLSAAAVESDVTVERGGDAVLEVTVTAIEMKGITYKWYLVENSVAKLLETETTSQLALTNVLEGQHYECRVRDCYGYENWVSFQVKVVFDNQLTAEAEESRVIANVGESVTLQVNVSARDTSGISYVWYHFVDEYDDETGVYHTHAETLQESGSNTLVINPVSGNDWVNCQVYDAYGEHADVSFKIVTDYQLKARAIQERFTVEPGESATLVAYVVSGDEEGVTYTWSKVGEDGALQVIEGETTNGLVLDSISESGEYQCSVTDRHGYTDVVNFYIYVVFDNELSLDLGEGNLTVDAGDSLTLQATVSAKDASKITYRWYRFEDVYDEENGDYVQQEVVLQESGSNTLVLDHVTFSGRVYVKAMDQYGNELSDYYEIHVDNQLFVDLGNWNVSVNYGDDVTLQATITAKDTEGILCKWYEYEEGYDEEGNYFEKEVILQESASNSLRIGSVTSRRRIWIEVRDRYGNAWGSYFEILINNHLSVKPKESDVGVDFGKDALLEVIVTADHTEGLEYQWYRETEDGYEKIVEEGNAASLTVKNITGSNAYRCTVSDSFDNVAYAIFSTFVNNHFSVTADQTTIFVKPGEDAELKVNVSAKDTKGITIEWYHYIEKYDLEYDDYDYVKESFEATGDTLKLAKVTDEEDIYCHVEDAYGNSKTIFFYVKLSNRFQARALTTKMGYQEGEIATLKVEVSGDDLEGLSYEWEKITRVYQADGDYQYSCEELDEDSDTLVTEPVTQFTEYRCCVSDQYGHSKTAFFYVYVETGMQVSEESDREGVEVSEDTVEFTLKVRSDDAIRYIWWNDDDDVISDGASCSIQVPKGSGWYECRAVNSYGQVIRREFGSYSSEENGKAWAEGGNEKVVTAGDSVTLQVATNMDPSEIEGYEWYSVKRGVDEYGLISSYEQYFTIIKGEETSSLKLENVMEDGKYEVDVWSKYGYAEVHFKVYVDQKPEVHLTVDDKELSDDEELCVQAGDKVVLHASATGFGENAMYVWKENRKNEYVDSDWYLMEETSDTLEVTAAHDGLEHKYICYVTDGKRTATASVRLKVQSVCTVTFEANGGKGTMDPVTLTNAETYELPKCTFTPPAGKVFIAWVTDEGSYQAGDVIPVNTSNITLRAEWKKPETPELTNAVLFGGSVILAWTASEGVDQYAVFRKTDSGKWKKLTEVSGTIHTDSDVKKGHTYCYTVRGVNEYGNYVTGYDTNGISVTISATVDKSAPVLTSVTSGTYGGVFVVWKQNSGVDRYAVFRKRGSGKWTKVGESTIPIFADDLTAEGTYSYTVRGIDENGKYVTSYDTTGKSVTIGCNPQETLDKSSPVLRDATAEVNGITVTWAANGGVFKYAIFRKVAGGKWTRVGETTGSGIEGIKAVAGSTCSFVDETAVAGTTYTYTVRGLNKNGKYVTSYDATGIKATMIGSPAEEPLDKTSPLLGNATAGANGITVNWTANSGVPKYAVFRKVAGSKWTKVGETTGSGDEAVKATAGSACSFVDGTAVAGTTYIYTVRGMDESGKYITNYDTNGVSVKAK